MRTRRSLALEAVSRATQVRKDLLKLTSGPGVIVRQGESDISYGGAAGDFEV